jgi:hypothetical protein
MRRGAKVLFLSGVLFPVFLMLSLLFKEGALMIIPVCVLFIALVMLLYARLFGEEILTLKSEQAQTKGLGTAGGAALPRGSNIPLHEFGKFGGSRVRTNELAPPASVTEHTTKLLDNE